MCESSVSSVSSVSITAIWIVASESYICIRIWIVGRLLIAESVRIVSRLHLHWHWHLHLGWMHLHALWLEHWRWIEHVWLWSITVKRLRLRLVIIAEWISSKPSEASKSWPCCLSQDSLLSLCSLLHCNVLLFLFGQFADLNLFFLHKLLKVFNSIIPCTRIDSVILTREEHSVSIIGSRFDICVFFDAAFNNQGVDWKDDKKNWEEYWDEIGNDCLWRDSVWIEVGPCQTA